MKTAIRVGGPTTGGREQFEAMLRLATEAERLGVDSAWSAEAWGMDAVAPLAFLAARTESLRLGTGIMQLAARTPAATAMTAMSMDTITNGRFLSDSGRPGHRSSKVSTGSCSTDPPRACARPWTSSG